MSVDSQIAHDISKETGYNLYLCKLALEQSNQNKEQAINNVKLWTSNAFTLKHTEDTNVKEYGAIETFYDPIACAGAIVKISSINSALVSSKECKELLEAAAREVANTGGLYTLDYEIDKLNEQFNTKLHITFDYIEKNKEQASLLTTYNHKNNIGVMVVLTMDDKEKADLLLNHRVKQFAFDCALHIAAFNPLSINDALPNNIKMNLMSSMEKELLREGKDMKHWETIITGKLQKLTKQSSLLSQIFIKSEAFTVEEVKARIEKHLQAKFKITDFIRVKA